MVTFFSSVLLTILYLYYTHLYLRNVSFIFFFPQVIGNLRASDKDDRPASFTFSLASDNSNFSIKDYGSKSLCVYLPSFVSLNGAWKTHWPQHLLLCNSQKLFLKLSVLLLKSEIILTCQSMLWFSQPDGGFRGLGLYELSRMHNSK